MKYVKVTANVQKNLTRPNKDKQMYKISKNEEERKVLMRNLEGMVDFFMNNCPDVIKYSEAIDHLVAAQETLEDENHDKPNMWDDIQDIIEQLHKFMGENIQTMLTENEETCMATFQKCKEACDGNQHC